MKKKYEKPEVELMRFALKEGIMDEGEFGDEFDTSEGVDEF